MFKKPFHQKTATPLRSSDRRKLLQEILDTFYRNEVEKHTALEKEDMLDEEKTKMMEEYSQLKADLVPETVLSCKIQTHIGEHAQLYTSEGQPLWIRTDQKELIPTVYMLWKRPKMLPQISTWSAVVNKLIGGADLMLPGVMIPEEGLPPLRVGDLVAVVTQHDGVPVAVGKMAINTADVPKEGALKGKAVLTIHTFKDHLWAQGDKSQPPALAQLEQTTLDDRVDETAKELEALEVTEEKVEEASTNEQAAPSLTPADVDELLRRSLYQALVLKFTEADASKLPMIVSAFYSNYVLPARPVGCDIDVKQSSWKKITKFMKAMEKTGLLKVKEMRGEMYLTSVNWKHPSLLGFVPYTMEKPSRKDASTTQNTSTKNTKSANQHEMTVQNLYKPTGTAKQLFTKMQLSTDALYDKREITKILDDYVRSNNLVDSKRKSFISLDSDLAAVLLNKEERNTVTQLPRASLTDRLCQAMSPYHVVEMPGQEPVVRKGLSKPVQIIVESRVGRKTVTRIMGLETYLVDLDEISKKLQTACAGSVAINPIPGKKDAQEVMVQGNHVDKVEKLLLQHGIPKHCFQVLDKTSKGKHK